MIARMLFELAKRPPLGRLVGYGFALAGPLLPVRRVFLSDTLIAFYHPRPVWPEHLLLVPRRPVPHLLALARPAECDLFGAIVRLATTLVYQQGLARTGYTLCANGGPRQEVGQVHFHLYAEDGQLDRPGPATGAPLRYDGQAAVWPHPTPRWATHLVSAPPLTSSLAGLSDEAIGQLLSPLPALDRQWRLVERGYTLYVRGCGVAEPVALHIAAGERQSH